MKCHCCNKEYFRVEGFQKTYACKECGHIYQNWGKSEEWVSNYYLSYREDHPMPEDKDRELWTTNISDFFVKNCDLNNKKVLEIGAYDGKLISKVSEHFENCELHVNDIDSGAKENLEKKFSNIQICSFLETQGDFDALIAVDVWEHFDDVSLFHKKVLDVSFEYLLLQVPVMRTLHCDKVEFRPHYHNPTLKSFYSFWNKEFNLISYKLAGNNFSARGPELLCVFQKK